MHILMTVNAAWNILNFRRPLVEALAGAGHRITVLAPPDDAVPELERMGCRVRPLKMSVKGLNPLEDLKLQRRFGRIFLEERPDAVLSYTIKNNVFGARAAKSAGVPFLPNVTGLGTAFLSGKLLQTVTEQLYRRSFATLPVVFFQNADDRSLFIDRRLVQPDQARLLPGSGIDLQRFAPAPMPTTEAPPVFLMIARLLRDKGVLAFVEAARMVKTRYPQTRFQLLGAVGGCVSYLIVDEHVFEWEGGGRPMSVDAGESTLIVSPVAGFSCTDSEGREGWGAAPCYRVMVWDEDLRTFWSAQGDVTARPDFSVPQDNDQD